MLLLLMMMLMPPPVLAIAGEDYAAEAVPGEA
jgi:hypothetical protein